MTTPRLRCLMGRIVFRSSAWIRYSRSSRQFMNWFAKVSDAVKVLLVMLRKSILFLLVVLFSSLAVNAQEVEVDRYSITARVDAAANAVDVRAALTLSNLSQAPKSRLYLRLAKLAKVSS